MSTDLRARLPSGTESWFRFSAVVCFAIAAVLWLGPDIARKDLFNGDAAHHVFWFYQYADPALFPDDLSMEYFASGAVAPIGYRALYSTVARFVDVLAAEEWMSVVLLGASVWLAWLLGRALGNGDNGRLKGLLCVVALLVLLPRTDLIPAMGFQRTFALPLTLLCLWALVAKRYAWVGIAWLGAALFYPVIIAVLGLAGTIVFLIELVQERRMPKWWIWNGVLGIAALAIILLGSTTPDAVGPSVTFDQAMTMPEFGPGGRQVLFGTDWKSGFFRHHRTGLGWSPWVILGMGIALALAGALGYRKEIPRPVIVLGGAGLFLWAAARLTLFTLYLPNRHSRYSLAAVLIVALAVAGYAVFQTLARFLARNHAPWSRGLGYVAAGAAPLIVAAILAPYAVADWERPVDTDLERTYSFLETLPKDTLVAAHPDLANYIPLRSKRSVLASTEGWIAFMLGYHERTTPRVAASLEAAYATTWSDLVRTLAPYGVDVFVSADSVFDKQGYDPPLDELASRLLARGRAEGFVMQDPPPGHVLFRSGQYVVVEVRDSERSE